MIELARRSFLGGLGALLLVRPVLTLPEHAILVDAANQQGGIITTEALNTQLFVGDIITFEGVEAYNVRYGGPRGRLGQFVVTKQTEIGERMICLYPYLVPPWPGNVREDLYATVCALPRRGARVEVQRYRSSPSVQQRGNLTEVSW